MAHHFTSAARYTGHSISGPGTISVHVASPARCARFDHEFSGIGGAFDVADMIRRTFDLSTDERRTLAEAILSAIRTAQKAMHAAYGRD